MSSLSVYSDQELMVMLKAGNEDAFTEIYKRYGTLLYYQANQMLRDREAAKDLVQDLFITIWNNPENINISSNLAGYFYISVRNRVFKLIEKRRVRSDYLTAIEYSRSNYIHPI